MEQELIIEDPSSASEQELIIYGSGFAPEQKSIINYYLFRVKHYVLGIGRKSLQVESPFISFKTRKYRSGPGHLLLQELVLPEVHGDIPVMQEDIQGVIKINVVGTDVVFAYHVADGYDRAEDGVAFEINHMSQTDIRSREAVYQRHVFFLAFVQHRQHLSDRAALVEIII